MEAVRNVFSSLSTAVRHVRVWLFAWLVFTCLAALVVLPAWRALDDGLSHRPAAGYLLDPVLDADLARTRPDLTLTLTGALLAALVFGAFLSGGVLATVGVPGRRFRFAQMLGEGGFLLLRTIRVLLVGAVIALAIGWGLDRFDAWLAASLRDVEPGGVALGLRVFDLRWIHVIEAVAWARGCVFVGLLFVTKVAIVRVTEPTSRSALVAFVRAVGQVLRRPLRAALIVTIWVLIWGLGSHAIGSMTAWFLEVDRNLWAGAAAGQLGVVLGQWVLVGILLSARRFRGAPAVAPAV